MLNQSKPFLFLILFICFQLATHACSMYKVTVHDKTMVGCNEDAWRINSRLWFVNPIGNQKYGAAFTGSREVGKEVFAPQSGMNTAGLTFSRLASYYPKQEVKAGLITINNEVEFLSNILLSYASVEEVKEHLEKYDRSFFIEDVIIYIDSSGKYLVMEPYKLIVGDDANYVLSNFCPSITANNEKRDLERYRNGEDFLISHKADTSIAFLRSVSDTMHVRRNKAGDGTLLTSIWNTKKGLVNLYFYHNFDTTIQYNIHQELAKGDHMYNLVELFPENEDFERLKTYITPFNTPIIRIGMVFLGGVLTILALFYFVLFFKNKKNGGLLAFGIMNLILTFYLAVLATNIYIYYFDGPYVHHNSILISLSSYIPFLLLLSLFPNYMLLKRSKWNNRITFLSVFNGLIYMVFIAGFAYWGLFDIFK